MWLRGLVTLVLAIAGCGRIAFDATDVSAMGSPDGTVPGGSSLVRSASSNGNNHLGLSVGLAIDAGVLVVVGAVECCGQSTDQMIASITDDGNSTYVSTGAIGVSMASTTEIWYAIASQPVTNVSAAFGNSGTFAYVWVAELSGVNTLDTALSFDGDAMASAAGASVDTARGSEIVISVLEIDGDQVGGPPADPFASLGAGTRQDCAYRLQVTQARTPRYGRSTP